ncbi:hypothetical protein FQR65_LT16657 [Abscondita terminalis]|nr:hypothetical protein FQR65_LT16657 [Abscondita terminalis]
MKKIFLLFAVFAVILLPAKGQQELSASKGGSSWIWGPSVGYQYQKGNFLKVSGWGLFAPNDNQYMKIDAGANFTWMMDKTTVIPELGFTYYLSDKGVWPFLKGEITPYTVTPKAGAQKNKWIWGPSLGYQYQSGNFLKVSGWNLFALNSKEYIKADAGADFTWMRIRTTVIPELGFYLLAGVKMLFGQLERAEVYPLILHP